MNKTEAARSLTSTNGFFRHWMSNEQRLALTHALRGGEGDYFAALLTDLKAKIEAMPETYDTEGIAAEDKVVHLHYFRGSVDAWVVEKDSGSSEETEAGQQCQAYGKVSLYGERCKDAEWGYLSIQELIESEVELDLYWEVRTVKEVK